MSGSVKDVIRNSQSEASIQVTWSLSTNQRPVSPSCDHSWPDQGGASISVMLCHEILKSPNNWVAWDNKRFYSILTTNKGSGPGILGELIRILKSPSLPRLTMGLPDNAWPGHWIPRHLSLSQRRRIISLLQLLLWRELTESHNERVKKCLAKAAPGRFQGCF